MTKWKMLCWLTLLVPGAALAQSAATMSGSAKKIMTGRLIDPRSLAIRNTSTKTAKATDGRTVTILCGEYNAKNRFGGYVGYKTFIYEPVVMKGVLSFDQAFALEFMSADGQGDVTRDADSAIQSGASLTTLTARSRTATDFAPVSASVSRRFLTWLASSSF